MVGGAGAAHGRGAGGAPERGRADHRDGVACRWGDGHAGLRARRVRLVAAPAGAMARGGRCAAAPARRDAVGRGMNWATFRRWVTFRRLEVVSFTHSCVFLALLL